jgi:polysaccharide lyase-like protein
MTNHRFVVGVAALVAGAINLVGCSGGSSGTGGGGSGASGAAGATGGPGAGGAGAGSVGASGAPGGGGAGAGSVGVAGAAGTPGAAGSGLAGATGAAGGGVAGTTGAAATGGTASAGQCPSDAIFCADFENGAIPSAATFYPAYQRAMSASYMTVDGTMGANGSTHALKVTPGSNFSQMLGVPTGVSTFWTRMYIQTAVDTSLVTGHDTFVAAIDDTASGGMLASAGDPNNGEHIRIGEHECQLEINRKSDDKEILSDAVGGNSNYTCAGGVSFTHGVWYCLEIFYDGPNSTVQVYVDNNEVSGLNVTNWGPYNYDLFTFGFENYGGTSRDVWYDDVAIAKHQIGCFR